MGSNEVNWIPRSLKNEFDLTDYHDQEMLISFLAVAETDTVQKVLEPVLLVLKSHPQMDDFVVRLAQGLLSHRSSHLTQNDRDNYIQTIIHLLSDEERLPDRNTIYQLMK